MTVQLSEWLRLRRLLREAAEAAGRETEEPADPAADLADDVPAGAIPLDHAERERVIELGVTGFIVRIAGDNPVLLGAISRVQGWRPNPSGSHHVPATMPAITSLLAFAEMYDFELTDGADAMVRQLIRDSYSTREWHRQVEATAAAAAAAAPPRPVAVPKPPRRLVWDWLRHHARTLAVAALIVYLTGPLIAFTREAERSYLTPAPLGSDTSLTAVLGALERCVGTVPTPGSPLPPGCDASIATRPAVTHLAAGLQNPRVRIFSLSTLDGARGFALCDQNAALEECWSR